MCKRARRAIIELDRCVIDSGARHATTHEHDTAPVRNQPDRQITEIWMGDLMKSDPHFDNRTRQIGRVDDGGKWRRRRTVVDQDRRGVGKRGHGLRVCRHLKADRHPQDQHAAVSAGSQ